MSRSEIPPGWYPDPSGTAGWRWWDGDEWTADLRPAPSRDRTLAAVVIGGLVLVSLGVVLAMVLTAENRSPDLAIGDGSVESEGNASTNPGSSQRDDDQRPEGGGAPADPAEGGDTTADGGGRGGGVGSEDTASEERSEDETSNSRGVLHFDGVCQVEVEPEEIDDATQVRPWQFPECDRAPIDLDVVDTSWIVVVASLSGDGFSEAEALQRAQSHGLDDQVLWSSHYRSLNPDLWVVFDGPFRTEAAATAAAERIGGGSYPRELSDDEGDRYCIADDGCVGERAD